MMNMPADSPYPDSRPQEKPVTYPITTICGTMRLFSAMLTVADELTRQGSIVLMPFTRKGKNSLSVQRRIEQLELATGMEYDREGGNHLNATPITAEELDRQHRVKIDMADLVIVVTDFEDHIMRSDNHGLYFGESTQAEMNYARSLGKPVKLARLDRHDYRDTIHWLNLPVEVPARG